MSVVTIAERKAREIERLRRAGAAASDDLRDVARRHGVTLSLFGSFARGDLVAGSDFDLMVDGPEAGLRAARIEAEAICERHGLKPDVLLVTEASPKLLDRVRRDGFPLR